ncbi:Protein of unknown function, partial [Cotesia congregata]
VHDAIANVTSDAQAVADWAKDHGLEINLNKTSVMLLGTNSKLKMIQRESLPSIIVNGVALPYTDSSKCLGLHVSNYCSIVLTDATYDNNRKLQTAMNSAIRFIYNLKRDEHISPHRRNLGWLSIKSRRIYYLSCFFYKLLDVNKPCYLRELFVDITGVRRADRLAAKRNNVKFTMPKFLTTSFEYSFVVSSIRLWEELPSEIVYASSIEIFKNKLYDYLFNLDV